MFQGDLPESHRQGGLGLLLGTEEPEERSLQKKRAGKKTSGFTSVFILLTDEL